MASVWRHPNSKYWSACYTDHSGRQVKRSTKKTDRDDALRVALEYEHAEAQARDGTLTEAQCRRVLSDILERTTGDHIRNISTKEYFDSWQTDKEASNPTGTTDRYGHTVELFLEHIGDKAKRPITAITARDVQGFMNSRLKAGRATKTVSVDMKTLRSVFNRARRQGIIQANPAEAVDMPRVESAKREPFTHAEVEMLVKAAPSRDWKTAILLGYYTSARLSDCVTMGIESIDLARGIIDYKQSKTGKRVVVPIHPDLEQHLMSVMSSDKPETYLCPTLAEKKTGGAHGLSAKFKGIMRDAGIDTKSGPGMGHRTFSKLTFHSLRHAFNSALANAGVDQELRMKLTGHTTPAVNTDYTHHEIATLKSAINKLPALTKT